MADITIQGITDSLQSGLDSISSTALGTASAIGGGAIVGSAVTGGILALNSKTKSTRKKRKSKAKTSRKRNSRSRHRVKKHHYTSHKRIHYTKNGQPYVIKANGRALFIKRSSAKRSRKLKGGRY